MKRINIVNEGEKFNKKKYEGALGDYDKDGLANIDDANPYTSEKNPQKVEQIELSKTFEKLLTLKNQLDDTMDITIGELDTIAPKGSLIYARTKTPYSILKKLVEKRLTDKQRGLTDLVGTTIVVDDLKDLRKVDKAIKKGEIGKVVEREDMYKNPKGGYRAIHYLVEVDGYIVEVQLKTKRQKAINEQSHEAYKKGTLNSEYLLYVTDLANKADKGNRKAYIEFDRIIDNPTQLAKDLDTSFEFGGEITRSYDVNVKSGVGTYAKGGNLKSMQKIRLPKSFSDKYMPSVKHIYFDKSTNKYYFIDFEGDSMELRNEYTLEKLKEEGIISMAKGGELMDADTQVEYANGGSVSFADFNPAYPFAKGGEVEQEYEDIRVRRLWNERGYDGNYLGSLSEKELQRLYDTEFYFEDNEFEYAKGGWIQDATAEMEKKGTIGSFTAKAKRYGLTPQEFAKKVLADDGKTNYTLKTKRQAQFMKNANPEMFSDGGEINRSYDVNINSGVGTYATGGVTEAGDVDFPSQMLNYAKGGKITIPTENRKIKRISISESSAYIHFNNGEIIQIMPLTRRDEYGDSYPILRATSIEGEEYNRLLAKGGNIMQDISLNANTGDGNIMPDASSMVGYAKGGKTDVDQNLPKEINRPILGYVKVRKDIKSSAYKDVAKKGDILPYTEVITDSNDYDDYYEQTGVIAWYKGSGNEYSFDEVEYLDNYAKGGKLPSDLQEFTLTPQGSVKSKGQAQEFAKFIINATNAMPLLKEEVYFATAEDTNRGDASNIKSIRVRVFASKEDSKTIDKLADLFHFKVSSSKKAKIKDGKLVYAKGGKTQGYNSRLDESLAERDGAERGFEQKKKDRRDESKAMEKSSGKRAYSSVKSMDKNDRFNFSFTDDFFKDMSSAPKPMKRKKRKK